jgi:chromosome partitioning protein
MKKVVIGTLKGGVGKTQMVFNLGGFLAQKGKKILIFDNDPQSNTTNDVGVDKRADNFCGAEEIYENNVKAEDIIVKSPISALPTLDIICGSIALTRSDMMLISQAGREYVLRKWIKNNQDILNEYDYMLFDTNPTMSVINQNVFLVADSIILVSDVGENSFEGADTFIELWSDVVSRLEIENNIKAFIVNKVRNGLTVDKQYLDFLKADEVISSILISTTIPLNPDLSKSEINKLPINLYDIESSGGQAYMALVEELIEKGVL